MRPTLVLHEEDDATALQLLLRLRALGIDVQRVVHAPSPQLCFGADHRLDTQSRSLHAGNRLVPLTLREYELLHFLVLHPAQVFSRDELIEQVWHSAFQGYSHTVSSHINRLRSKIEPDPRRPCLIRTAWGIGYLFDPQGHVARG